MAKENVTVHLEILNSQNSSQTADTSEDKGNAKADTIKEKSKDSVLTTAYPEDNNNGATVDNQDDIGNYTQFDFNFVIVVMDGRFARSMLSSKY